MRFKDNVTITFTLTNQYLIKKFEEACRDVLGTAYEPLCSGGLEGTHSVESGHYHGRALDFRTRDIPLKDQGPLAHRYGELLGDDYFVKLEVDHIHAQRNKNTF